jgi:hypothetical protein
LIFGRFLASFGQFWLVLVGFRLVLLGFLPVWLVFGWLWPGVQTRSLDQNKCMLGLGPPWHAMVGMPALADRDQQWLVRLVKAGRDWPRPCRGQFWSVLGGFGRFWLVLASFGSF